MSPTIPLSFDVVYYYRVDKRLYRQSETHRGTNSLPEGLIVEPTYRKDIAKIAPEILRHPEKKKENNLFYSGLRETCEQGWTYGDERTTSTTGEKKNLIIVHRPNTEEMHVYYCKGWYPPIEVSESVCTLIERLEAEMGLMR